MNAGISGMKNFQTQLDEIGNNIANVETSGFKKGRVNFQDMFSQMTSGAQAPTDEKGGVNPKQVGLGAQEGSIDNIHTEGSSDTTGRNLDFAIDGDGMFAVAKDPEFENGEDGPIDADGTDISYTRAGNFYLDEDGNIVNEDGHFLLGRDAEENEDGELDVNDDIKKINIDDSAQDFSVAEDGTVNVVDGDGDNEVVGVISLANFSNPEGLQKDGDNLYVDSPNAGKTEDEDGNVQLFTPGDGGTGSILSSTLEMSNVDLAEEFSDMITAQRSFQANTRAITTSDEILQELVNLKQ